MKKVNVVGTTGSGKSTFSKSLSERLGVPYIEMDNLFWKDNWVESSDEELIEKLKKSISEESWVLDGNYSRTTQIKWETADTVIWLNYGYFRTLFQLLRRSLARATSKKTLWPDSNNRESYAKLLSRDSILPWFFRCYSRNRKRYPKMMSNDIFPNVNFITLTSPAQANKLLTSLSKSQKLHP